MTRDFTIGLVLTSLLVLPLPGTRASGQRGDANPPVDSALLHTVMLDLQERYGSILEVDPWVLDSGIHVQFPASLYRIEHPEPIRQSLRAMLLTLGIRAADSVSVGTCPGTFVADSADARCPARRIISAAISLPRRGLDSTRTSLQLLGARAAPKEAEIAIRVVTAYVSPFGSELGVADHYYRRDDNEWKFVGRLVLSSSH